MRLWELLTDLDKKDIEASVAKPVMTLESRLLLPVKKASKPR